MIDPEKEQPISLAEAAQLFPPNAGGKRPSISQMYRYTTVGLRGTVLESLQCGPRRATTREAVARFFRQLTQTRARKRAAPKAYPVETAAPPDVEAALDRAGL